VHPQQCTQFAKTGPPDKPINENIAPPFLKHWKSFLFLGPPRLQRSIWYNLAAGHLGAGHVRGCVRKPPCYHHVDQEQSNASKEVVECGQIAAAHCAPRGIGGVRVRCIVADYYCAQCAEAHTCIVHPRTKVVKLLDTCTDIPVRKEVVYGTSRAVQR